LLRDDAPRFHKEGIDRSRNRFLSVNPEKISVIMATLCGTKAVDTLLKSTS
jgi:hypothetical protein